MVHSFSNFEIDEPRREVRVGARVLEMQPRIFDLLVYLARHRERVVPKDELLDAVWPGVIVTDGSLQRAISLARTALAAEGITGLIQTHARRGYRLMEPMGPEQEANGDWTSLPADELAARAWEALFDSRADDALARLEAIVAVRQQAGDLEAAAWAALLIGQLRLERREPILAKGWQHRAARWLAETEPGRTHGHLHLLETRLALLENEPGPAHQGAERCRQAGERWGDADLEVLGLVSLGEASLLLGRTREGLAALDEAGVAMGAGRLSPWAGGLAYCGLIFFCMTRCDWQRAGEWTEQFTRWSEQKGTATYRGLCQLHRTEALAIRGELGRAAREAQTAREMLARQNPWAEGAGWAQQGEIALATGDFARAREAFTQAVAAGWDARFELALLQLFEGDAAAAARQIGRLLDEDAWSYRSKRGRALAYHVMAAAQAGDPDTARARLAELEDEPELTAPPALQALVGLARAELAVLEQRLDDALRELRTALRTWLTLNAPLMAAHTHNRLAQVLVAAGDRAAAELEHEAAQAIFQRVDAPLARARSEQRFAALRQRSCRVIG